MIVESKSDYRFAISHQIIKKENFCRPVKSKKQYLNNHLHGH